MPTHLAIMDLTPDKRGSFESYAVKLAGRLEAEGWRSVAAFWGRPPRWLEAEFREAGAEVLVLSEQLEFGGRADWPPGWTRDLRMARLFARLGRIIAPDIVHLHFCVIFSPLPFGLRMGGVRNIVATEHISLPVRRRRGVRRAAARTRNRLCLRVMRRVLAVSGYVRRRLIESDQIPPEKVSVLYNGIDLGHFRPQRGAEEGRAVRTRLGLSEQCQVVICVAQLIDAKGLNYLIDAAAELRARPDLVVLIVGEGERRQALADHIRRLGLDERVQLLGRRDDVGELLAASDLFVCPSVWDEALGYVNLEAMAAGLPVVASRVGGIPEAVRDGETGLLTPPRDAQALAGAMASLLDDDARRAAMGRAGRRAVEETFSMEQAIERTVALYHELAATGAGRARRPLAAAGEGDGLLEAMVSSPSRRGHAP
jgi:glycosyltransferase involved in cell wall biosynthesis